MSHIISNHRSPLVLYFYFELDHEGNNSAALGSMVMPDPRIYPDWKRISLLRQPLHPMSDDLLGLEVPELLGGETAEFAVDEFVE